MIKDVFNLNISQIQLTFVKAGKLVKITFDCDS